jgi:AraC-like DNA-binding protein
LTERTVYFADTPKIAMDVLSQVLRSIRLDSALFFNAELTAPWCVLEPRSDEMTAALSPNSGHLVLYHYVLEGKAYAQLPGGAKVELAKGDIVMIPHGDSHLLGNGKYARPVDSMKAFEKNLSEGLKLARHGGGGEVTRLVCGFMVFEPRMSNVVLSGLPKIVKVHLSDGPGSRWIRDSIRFAVGEESGDGSGLVVAKLSEVLFVETLRRFVGELSESDSGWLAAARDPVIGKALARLHDDPARDWTVEDLAREVGQSRTRFAERFRQFIDDSPIAYLQRWRLKIGAEALLSTEKSVAEIASVVGYGSESAFNRAFKREYDVPPAVYRKSHRSKI